MDRHCSDADLLHLCSPLSNFLMAVPHSTLSLQRVQTTLQQVSMVMVVVPLQTGTFHNCTASLYKGRADQA